MIGEVGIGDHWIEYGVLSDPFWRDCFGVHHESFEGYEHPKSKVDGCGWLVVVDMDGIGHGS